MLIAATSPAVVLVVDAGTYVFSFATIAVAVRAGRRVAGTADLRTSGDPRNPELHTCQVLLWPGKPKRRYYVIAIGEKLAARRKLQ